MSRTLQTPRKGGRTETVTIAAGVTYQIQGLGNFVRCVDADDTLELAIDNSAETLIFNRGKAYRLDPGEDFTSIALRNPTGAPVDVTYFVGWGNYIDDSISGQVDVVVQNTTANPVYTEEATPTGYTSGAVTALATGNHVDIAANASRKLLVIYNDDATNSLWWRDQTGTANGGLPVGPKQTLIFSFAGPSRLRNNSGVSINYTVSEMT